MCSLHVEPQSFSFFKKRAHFCTNTQEEMRYESTQVKAVPFSSGRRMRPPTPLQNSNSSFEEEQKALRGGRSDVECDRKNDHHKKETVHGRTLQRQKLKLKNLGPDDTAVDFRRILEEARDEKNVRSI